MIDLVTRHWWVFAIRGIAAITFGVLAFLRPDSTLAALVLLFGAYVLVDGLSLLAGLVRGDSEARRHAWAVGIMGILGVLAGIATFMWPGITALSLLSIVAFWAVAMGGFQVIAAIVLRREMDGEIWMLLGGIASVAFGAFLLAFPGEGLLSVVWLTGAWSIAFGASNLGLAARLRGLAGMAPRSAVAH